MITENVRLLLNRMNPFCLSQLDAAAGYAMSRGHYEIGIEHLVIKCIDLDRSDIAILLQDLDVESLELKSDLLDALDGYRTGNTGRPVFSPNLLEMIENAWLIASVEFGHSLVRSGHLLMAIATPSGRRVCSWIDGHNEVLNREKISALMTAGIDSVEQEIDGEAVDNQMDSIGMEAIERFTNNITEKARQGKIDPVFARDDEIRQMMDILTRRRKNNPILVGEPGTGKTAIVEGFALKVTKGEVPQMFKDVNILTLDLALLQAGASVKGEFENRLRTVIDAIKSYPGPVITFIDEAHTLIGAGGAAGMGDAANLLKPALARGELRTIAATTWTEYKKYIEKDPALARRFQLIKVGEPEDEGAFSILRGLKKIYAKHHGVKITDDGIVASVTLSRRYLPGRLLPDKAIDLLDTAAARVVLSQNAPPSAIEHLEQSIASLEREKEALTQDRGSSGVSIDATETKINRIDERISDLHHQLDKLHDKWGREKALVQSYLEVTRQMALMDNPVCSDDSRSLSDNALEISNELQACQGKNPLVFPEVNEAVISNVIADWTGIPVGKMADDEVEKLLHLEQHLSSRIIGQDHAINRIIDMLRVAKTGLKSASQPMGVFLLTGPSGVGKTETGLGLASELFGGEQYVVTVNMSEYQEKHNVSKLIGSPPGYVGYGEGGVLTEAVRKKPYSVVLLDEVEKAHPDVMDIFYQVFDKGVLADGEGRIIDFSNTVIMVTSNLASTEISDIAEKAGDAMPPVEKVLEFIQPVLTAHFKPALLARLTVLPFYPLGRETMSSIVIMKLEKIAKRLERRKVCFKYDESLIEWIVSRCDLQDNGARNVESVINLQLLPAISVEMLSGMTDQDEAKEQDLTVAVEDGALSFQFEK